jgi:hypothetical protein
MDYEKKYIKYKLKYLKLKNLSGGGDENLSFFLEYNKNCPSIIEKYDSFSNKENINSPISFISKGSNGFVNNFNFKNNHDGNTFNIIVKTSLYKTADNLFYEFVVGQCVNQFKKYFPNFCYTFNYCFINDPENSLKSNLQNEGGISDLSELKHKLIINPIGKPFVSEDNFRFSCQNNSNVCIMIENIPNSIKFSALKQDPEFVSNLDYNYFCCLLQLYVALFSLSDLFTHYDLNTHNVMYIKLDKTIKITYDIKQFGKTISIYTKFIPVIIDYARAHVKCPEVESKHIGELVCTIKECNSRDLPLCDSRDSGMYFGIRNYRNYLGLYTGENNFENYHHINPRKTNKSHDLMHLHFLMYYHFQHSTEAEADPIKLKCNLRDNYEELFERREWTKLGNPDIIYGNKEFPHSYNLSPKKIKTTQDVVNWLIDYFDRYFAGYSTDHTGNLCIVTDLSEPFDFK